MALTASELARLRIELGYSGLTISAQSYVADGVTQIFEQVIGPYLQAGELNRTSTPVAAASAPTVVTLALLSTPTTIAPGDRLIVDDDAAQEAAHVQSVTASTVTLELFKAHVGTYPVTVEGAESIVRYYLRQCIAIAERIARSAGRAGIKRADEVEFFQSTTEQNGVIDDLIRLQRYWRGELAQAVGLGDLRAARSGAGGQLLESY